MSDPLDNLPDFVAEMQSRLEAGRAEYGDKSFSEHPATLLREIQEELLDTANWAFILWHRTERLRRALERLGDGKA